MYRLYRFMRDVQALNCFKRAKILRKLENQTVSFARKQGKRHFSCRKTSFHENLLKISHGNGYRLVVSEKQKY